MSDRRMKMYDGEILLVEQEGMYYMDKKREDISLTTNRFVPGENGYLNERMEVTPSSAILNENKESNNDQEEQADDYEFLYWH
jgi:hypothetical protein